MTDQTSIDHERRLTRLEDRFEVVLTQIAERLQKLEQVADQGRVDKEQAERRETAGLRQELAALKGHGV
jgi:(p)ppGpp synthase/HD superfamily hydrolase